MDKETGIPSKEDIQRLPRWAIVAFAARCARRVQPLFQMAWPEAPQGHVEAIDRAIGLAERSSTSATARFTARFAIRAAARAAARAAEAVDPGDTLAADHVALVARAAAEVALAAAADVAHIHAITAIHNAIVSNYIDVVDSPVKEGIWTDLGRLIEAATREGWTDQTPVPPEFFGPLWPEGEPDWARLIKRAWIRERIRVAREKQSVRFILERAKDEKGLCLHLYVDEYTGTEDQVAEEVIGLIHALNQYHIALGGNGLAIEDFQTLVQQDVSVGVGR